MANATAVSRRYGTRTEHAAFRGVKGEITVDTTQSTLWVHTGNNQQGTPLAREDLQNVSLDSVVALGVAKRNMSNVDTTNLATSISGHSGGNLAYADLSNVTIPSTIEQTVNKVTTISASSTDTQYPSAKAVHTALNTKQNTLTAGDCIDITNNTISATGVLKTANASTLAYSSNVEITNPVINQTLKYDGSKWVNQSGGSGAAAWGSITGILSNQTDLQTALDEKQIALKEGGTIQISGTKTENVSSTLVVQGSDSYYTLTEITGASTCIVKVNSATLSSGYSWENYGETLKINQVLTASDVVEVTESNVINVKNVVRDKDASELAYADNVDINFSTLANGQVIMLDTSLGTDGKWTNKSLVTSVSSSSTHTEIPSAKCVYDILGNIESLLAQI